MYWFRSSPLDFLSWLGLALAWWAGGWLVAAHAFRLERRERLLAGFALGLVLELWAANVLAHWLPAGAAFWGAAFGVLAAGGALAFWGEKPFLDWRDLRVPGLLGGAALAGWVFLRMAQGLGIFDEYVHLPLISTLAAGEIPPRYFVNSEVRFAYHYGFQLFGASLMRLGGLFPWSAFDLSKALTFGGAVGLAWLVGRRTIPRKWGALLLVAALLFAGGTRYLLLLAPQGLLVRVDHAIALQGDEAVAGLPFSQLLSQPWRADGGPPSPLIFGYMSGIAEPFVLTQAGINTMNGLLLLLVWLLAGRAKGWRALPVLAAVYAFWALTAETGYGLFGLGLGVAAAALWARRREAVFPWVELAALAVSGLVVAWQGGLVTEIARGLLAGKGSGAAGFGLRWPPAILSKHLGPLSLFSPLQIFVALFELGPVVAFTPWLTVWAWRRLRQGEWITGALMASAWAGFGIPIFLDYQSERDMARVAGHALLVWSLMLVIVLFEDGRRGMGDGGRGMGDGGRGMGGGGRIGPPLRKGAGAALGLAMFGGLMTGGILLTAAPQTVLSYGFTSLDAEIAAQTWGKLPPSAEIYDPEGWRATALTGLLTRAITGDLSFGTRPRPEWEELRAAPTAEGLLANGYRFVYVDNRWWGKMPETGRESLSQACAQTVAEAWDDSRVHFRRLVDLEGCGR